MEEGDDASAAILKLLKFSPRGMSITDISKKLKRDRNAVARQLDVLKAEGKVDTRQIGTARVYWLSQRVPLSAFLCFTQNMILILDRNMNIVQANDKYTALTGYTKDDLIGKNLRALKLPIVSEPDVFGIIESTDKEQVITDVRSQVGNDELFFKMEVIPTSFEAGETGLTIVLEDITEKKRHLKNMEFLARTAMELVDLPPEADIYGYIAERVAELVPDNPRYYVFSYDQMKGEFSFAAVKSEAVRQRTKEISGVDPVGIKWPLTEFFYSEPFFESAATFKDMRVMHFRPFYEEEEYSFYDACAHVFPKDLCDVFVREFNIAKIYLTGLVWQDQVFGQVGIILGRDEELENRQAIESFFRQASIALARRMTEERLLRSDQRFFDLVTLSDKPALVFNQEGKSIIVNPGFTTEFGYT
ncbi:MAG: PAS domain S-box protein, partial [Methanoregulaceae archaeon]|nr:PAS domain S-box protein [Methanoregulaceae archaeon]